jgi:hypothetical protein
MQKTTHSSARLPIWQKMYQFYLLLFAQFRRIKGSEYAQDLFADIDEYRQLYLKYSGSSLETAKIFEIGYGARPYRLIALISLGYEASGIDLDSPILRFRINEFFSMYKRNGIERAVKSAIRYVLFDGADRRHLEAELSKRGREFQIVESRFMVGDTADAVLGDNSLDLVISEDVFEHIPVESLRILTKKIAKAVTPGGLCLIRPNIFTGITGSHLVEWYPQNLQNHGIRRKSEPWEHLRKKRYSADSYLNELRRSDYRAMFMEYFDILEERVKLPMLGHEYLTTHIRKELDSFGDDELFSNQVLFVLRKKKAA